MSRTRLSDDVFHAALRSLARVPEAHIVHLRSQSPEHSLAWQFSERTAPYDQLPLLVLDRLCRAVCADSRDLFALTRTCREWERRTAQLPWVVEQLRIQRAAHLEKRLRQRDFGNLLRVCGVGWPPPLPPLIHRA